jgi:cytochrome c553
VSKSAFLKRWLLRAIVVVSVLGAGAFVTVLAGLVPVKASADHWAITNWFLHFAMRRSVATHTIGSKLPSLDDARLVLKGAGHFEIGCRPCHGSPELPQPRVTRAMLPAPPYLPARIASWTPEELFYIVKHGIKMTGMPAWPSQQRDDEVRAMVAFLEKLPELDVAAYRRLVHGETAEVARVPLGELRSPGGLVGAARTSCGRCHGVDGLGRGGGAFPRLAGQPHEYLAAALQAYANDKRASGTMQPIAAALDAEEVQALAAYYSGLPAGGRRERKPPTDTAAISRGEAIATQGVPRQDVPSCQDCHGPGSKPRNPAYPRHAGQDADYLVLQLDLFREGRRGGSRYEHVMRPIAGRMTPEQMRDVALFYEALSPAADLRSP